MKILVAGSGGREHAISWKLAQSALVDEVLCVPGNGGTATEAKCRNVCVEECDCARGLSGNEAIAKIAVCKKVDMVVVGPEDPLCAGLADAIWAAGIPVVGPKQAGALLEGSKDTAKNFMQKYGVAAAKSVTFTDCAAAIAYIKTHGAPIVIKADGLAAGKGVVVAGEVETAVNAVNDFMTKGTLGSAGTKLVIEDYLQGVEISVLAAVSVTKELAAKNKATIVPFVPSRDHKRLLDGAKGPNTGGMGAVAPLADVTAETMAQFERDILQPTLRGLIAEGFDYRGFIFFGVMLTKDGPKLLEYNVRLGDPETQAVLPLMDFDFAELCRAIADVEQSGALKAFEASIKWKKGFVCAPVAVSGGYPTSYKKGYEITLPASCDNRSEAAAATVNASGESAVKVFVAGAQLKADGATTATEATAAPLVTSGGRVLAVSGFGETFDAARKAAYTVLESISFTDMAYRHDIGLPGAAESGEL